MARHPRRHWQGNIGGLGIRTPWVIALALGGGCSSESTEDESRVDGSGESGESTQSGGSAASSAGADDAGGTDDGSGDAATSTGDGGTGEPPECGRVCCPGEHRCEGDISELCNEDGSGWVTEQQCDAVQGLACGDRGVCEGDCALEALGSSHLGCEFFPIITAQVEDFADANDFAVSVANGNDRDVTILVTRGDRRLETRTIGAGEVGVVVLPWVEGLDARPTRIVADGAYRIRADGPVSIRQHNSIATSTSADASLLLPAHAWGEDVIVASWEHQDQPGLYAVVAREDDTTVVITPSATGREVQAGAGVLTTGFGQLLLDRSDVLQVFSSGGDLTGTRIVADKPIAVIGGHQCATVPTELFTCDHLEEAMLPTSMLGHDFIVTPPVRAPDLDQVKATVVRVIANEAATEVAVEPDPGIDPSLANPGDFLDIPLSTQPLRITTDRDVVVVQYLVGAAQDGTADPSMVLVTPVDRYRTRELFHADPSWTANFVELVAPFDATVTLDGLPVGAWSAIGDTGFSYAHVQLTDDGTGRHEFQSDRPAGMTIHGYRVQGSYWVPGGY